MGGVAGEKYQTRPDMGRLHFDRAKRQAAREMAGPRAGPGDLGPEGMDMQGQSCCPKQRRRG